MCGLPFITVPCVRCEKYVPLQRGFNRRLLPFGGVPCLRCEKCVPIFCLPCEGRWVSEANPEGWTAPV